VLRHQCKKGIFTVNPTGAGCSLLDQVMRTRQISRVRSSNEYYGFVTRIRILFFALWEQDDYQLNSLSGSVARINGPDNRINEPYNRIKGPIIGKMAPHNRINGPIIAKVAPIIGPMPRKSHKYPRIWINDPS